MAYGCGVLFSLLALLAAFSNGLALLAAFSNGDSPNVLKMLAEIGQKVVIPKYTVLLDNHEYILSLCSMNMLLGQSCVPS